VAPYVLQLGFDRRNICLRNERQLVRTFTLRRISDLPSRIYLTRALRFDNGLASVLSPGNERRKIGERTVLAWRSDA
jgi:hypothetical protein